MQNAPSINKGLEDKLLAELTDFVGLGFAETNIQISVNFMSLEGNTQGVAVNRKHEIITSYDTRGLIRLALREEEEDKNDLDALIMVDFNRLVEQENLIIDTVPFKELGISQTVINLLFHTYMTQVGQIKFAYDMVSNLGVEDFNEFITNLDEAVYEKFGDTLGQKYDVMYQAGLNFANLMCVKHREKYIQK